VFSIFVGLNASFEATRWLLSKVASMSHMPSPP
jgi:hypothetical protein